MKRIDFIKMSALSGMGAALPDFAAARLGNPEQRKWNLGLASYTLRKFNVQQVIEVCKRLELAHISLKSFHLPLESSADQIKSVTTLFRQSGIDVYGAGVVSLKTEEEVQRAFEYAANAGLQTIIAVPNYELLDLTNKLVQQYNIRLAIHNHGPEDQLYPSVSSIYEKIKSLDKRVGFCIDIGHVVRNGEDPAGMIKKYRDRLYDIHMKDVSKAAVDGKPVELGRGVIDIFAVMKALKEIAYQDVVAFEYEKDEDDPLAGLAESVGFAKGCASALQ
jgi:inosose dehydratase